MVLRGGKKSDLGVGSGLRGHVGNSAWCWDEAVVGNSCLGWYGGNSGILGGHKVKVALGGVKQREAVARGWRGTEAL